MPESAPASADGRRLRSERNRAAIVDAALDLIREGVLVPTAQQISDRAGVGMRTFFRHFEDMESLFAAVDAHTRKSYEGLFELGERQGTIEERVAHAVQRRAEAFEQLKNMVLSTQAQLWRSQVLAKNYARNQRKLRDNLVAWLPEIEDLPLEQREAVDAAASFELWHRLRTHQGLSKKTCIGVVTSLLEQLLLAD